mmetsp:Transcript_47578/g.135307  ORF Transcript_47578/g.135307 Transcript_47578/m.135307 type:complete len:90 (+) Transcript_47578:380-649(+)
MTADPLEDRWLMWLDDSILWQGAAMGATAGRGHGAPGDVMRTSVFGCAKGICPDAQGSTWGAADACACGGSGRGCGSGGTQKTSATGAG